ncbi:MAG: hypothetical protein LBK67_10770, partial [Coriobacteriales bacterium]|nr:hypothetical protein [Coriobacteriales bacterium]
LTDIDRQNTLAYYSEFLEDAESEGQTDASAVLGSPHTLAAQIKADIAMGDLKNKGAGHIPSPTASATTAQAVPVQPTPSVPPWQTTAPPPTAPPPAKSDSGLKTLWIVLLAIFAIPVGLPLAIALVAVIFGLLVALFAILVPLFAVAVSFLAVGILACIIGFFFLFSEFAVGLFYMGMGLVTLGLCILVGMGCWYLAKLCVKGIARLFNAIRKKLTKKEGIAQ